MGFWYPSIMIITNFVNTVVLSLRNGLTHWPTCLVGRSLLWSHYGLSISINFVNGRLCKCSSSCEGGINYIFKRVIRCLNVKLMCSSNVSNMFWSNDCILKTIFLQSNETFHYFSYRTPSKVIWWGLKHKPNPISQTFTILHTIRDRSTDENK